MIKLNEMTYDEISKHVTEAIVELKLKAYVEGYEQGKFDQRMDSLEGRAKKRKEDFAGSRQEKRDRIVEQAKKDIEGLRRTGTAFGRSFEYRENLDGHSYFSEGSGDAYNGKFIVNKEKRTVVVLLIGWGSGKIRKRGIAKAHPNDCFNAHIGKAIALRRALGLEVPDEYLNAPHPAEVRVGDVVKYGSNPVKYEVLSTENIFGNLYYDHVYPNGKHVEGFAHGGEDFKYAKIIDDSREEEREEGSE